MPGAQQKIAQSSHSGPALFFAAVAGLFFFVVTLKFGDPVILDYRVQPPENISEAILDTWQIKWGYRFLLVLMAAGLASMRWRKLNFKWPLLLPLFWLGWELIAGTQSVSPGPHGLSHVTLLHFTACVILFYLGYFGLQGARHPWPLWAALALALCWIMRLGLEQHFGGLEATRRFIAESKNSAGFPPITDPEYLKRIASNRIFASFSNPDALAGCIVLLLPLTLVFIWQITPKVPTGTRSLFLVMFAGCGLACLYWSGSKGGWLVALVVAVLALGHSTIPLKWKRIVICSVLILGVAGFGVRYAGFFKKDKNSVGARFAYWRAALKVVSSHPALGTGPGTFSISYMEFKRPDDENTKLCHNDYLEQACDSGLPGFLFYTAMIAGCLAYLYRYRVKSGFTPGYAVWLGLFGLCLHSVVEYHLYIPALAWPMFFLLGLSMNFED